ncbi:hypothetical protein LIER_35847 [Lithospermum erythrorhizon]|uniref:Uncharacterized protein n=1 Tax=Lithospermum erythrorhizon TaxID=34254 RepID=A0AAV3NYH1_LITER
MPFSDQLDAFHLPPGFKLPQLELYDGTRDQSSIYRSLSWPLQSPLVEYSHGGRQGGIHGLLQRSEIWEDEERFVGANAFDEESTHNSSQLEELKVGTGQPADLRETVLKKEGNVSPQILSVWERIQQDKGQSTRKTYKGTFPQRGMARCNQKASTYEPLGNTPLRVYVAENFEYGDREIDTAGALEGIQKGNGARKASGARF